MLNKSIPILKIEACLIALLSFMFMSFAAFGQSGNASLTGTVQDPSGGVVPGAAITVRNVDTGVENRAASNDRGTYTFPTLQPGTYELTADAPGFSRTTRSDLRLYVGIQGRLDVTLAVAGTVTEVEVTGATESVILEAGSSTGTVMQEEILASIPMLTNNIMDLVQMMGGVSPGNTSDLIFGMENQQFAGVNSTQVNITRDGMSVNEIRFRTGFNANSNINSEMVGEFRMVLSAVDAEMGRGAGQVQMTTRSGSNAFHGSGTWSIQNTALDARDFNRKLTDTPQAWRNLNNYMLTASGPIKRNRTFFFATWEQQMARTKKVVDARVLTPCARKGIYRYIDGWIPSAAAENNSHAPNLNNLPTRPSVDFAGNILYGGTFYNSTTQTATQYPDSELKFESVFGPLDPTVRSMLADKNNPGGAHGNCDSLVFDGLNEQFGVSRAWDTRTWAQGAAYRNQYDKTGFVRNFTEGDPGGKVRMPDANTYSSGDGLNYAAHRWPLTLKGEGVSLYGAGGDPERKAVTFKIDHNINNDHRLSGTYSYESYWGDDGPGYWPESNGGYGGMVTRKPQSLMINLTSTLRPTLLNEFRFGLSRANSYQVTPFDAANGDKLRDVLQALLPTSGPGSIFNGSRAEGLTMILGIGEGALNFNAETPTFGGVNSHPYGGNGGGMWDFVRMTWGGIDPRWTFTDTVTWMKGAHSFKGGAELRLQSTMQDFTGNTGFGGCIGGCATQSRFPVMLGGSALGLNERRRGTLGSYAEGGANDDGVSWRGLPAGAYDDVRGSNGAVFTIPYTMMTYFSGSLAEARQFYYAIPDATRPTGARWSELANGEDRYVYTVANKEIHMFFKDDWKVTNDLTLNLGVRWEYYGVPHARDGKTIALKGGSDSLWGIQKPGFDTWMTNRESVYVKTAPGVVPDPVSIYQFVGPGSQNPNQMVFNKDINNFAPHLGFAWQLPWFGKGLTTLRGGWSVSYGQINSFDQFGVQFVDIGGATNSIAGRYQGSGGRDVLGTHNYYMDITDLPNILPMDGYMFGTEPLAVQPVGRFYVAPSSFNLLAHDDNIRNPYTHNFNLSLTRNIGRNLTIDVRYIGSMGRDQLWSFNPNQNNFVDNNLHEAFETVRRGGQSALINSLIPQNGPAGTQQYLLNLPNATGSEQLRSTAAGGQGSNLALGQYSSIAGALATSNGTISGILAPQFNGQAGNLLRVSCLPEDRPGYLAAFRNDQRTDVNLYPCEYGTPWNYIWANTQYSSSGTALRMNGYSTDYHSMQAQVTLRPTRGLNFQATYTWGRNLATSGWTNYYRDFDYGLSGQHRSHTLNTYGSWELPLGANGFFFRDASGAFKKAIEGWQLSWVTAMASGPPMSVTGSNTMWSNNYPILVRPDLWDDKGGKAEMTWDGDRFIGGKYFGDKYTKVLDRGICNTSMMQGDAFTPGTLYHQYCEYQSGGNVLLRSAPRAVAYSSGERDLVGNLIPMRYGSLEEARKYDPTAQMDLVGIAADGTPIYDNPPVIVFRNASQSDFNPGNPGAELGNFKSNRLTGIGRFTFDMAMSKSIEFMEGKRFEVRVDAQNILNHPSPSSGAPTYGYGDRIANPGASPSGLTAGTSTAAFGGIQTKGGHRTFQGRLSLRF